jgi:glycosyltransferase involved in cell wall biosynthesis
VNKLLKYKKFDLIFFSTTSFHLLALGVYWKSRFNIPFICDIQDPWRNDYYLSKPKKERPPKFWLNHLLDKLLEKITIPRSDAIISVSSQYCKDFKLRYPNMIGNCHVIPFGGVEQDFEVLNTASGLGNSINLNPNELNIIYIGRGGHDLKYAIQIFFKALKKGIDDGVNEFNHLHCWFIGTSYSAPGKGIKTIEPIALTEGVSEMVTEITDRLPYFETLALLKKADILFVPGSMDKGYTASKIYPYILAQKPLISLFHKESSVVEVLKNAKTGKIITFELLPNEENNIIQLTYSALLEMINQPQGNHQFDKLGFSKYTAEHMTRKIVTVFESV